MTTCPPIIKVPANDSESRGLSHASENVHFEVNLDAVAANYHLLKQYAGKNSAAGGQKNDGAGAWEKAVKILPVVKADSYGLGAIPVTQRLMREGADFVIVQRLTEAEALRAAFPDPKTLQIAIFDGPQTNGNVDEIPTYLEHHFVPFLNHWDQVAAWADQAGDSPSSPPSSPCILHLDTGMNRLGFTLEDTKKLIENKEKLSILKSLNIHSLHSHLATFSQPDNAMNKRQNADFRALTQRLQTELGGELKDVPLVLANSSGIFQGDGYHFDMVRPGRFLYGMPEEPAKNIGVHPVLRLSARILQINTVRKGDTVGYESTYTAPYDMTTATLGIGFADGLDTRLSNKGTVMFGDEIAPIIGRISMDLTTVDITHLAHLNLQTGAYADIINTHQTITKVAQSIGKLDYEFLTSLSKRHPPVYIET